MFKDVMQPLREASASGIITANFDFMAVDDSLPPQEFVDNYVASTSNLAAEVSLNVCVSGEKVCG